MQRVYTQSILLNFWIVCVCFFLNFKPFTFFRVPNVVMRFYIGSTLNKGVIRWTETKYTKSKQIIILVDGCWMCVRFLNISNIISFATENIIYIKNIHQNLFRYHLYQGAIPSPQNIFHIFIPFLCLNMMIIHHFVRSFFDAFN